MKKRLDEGQEIIGRYLDDSRYRSVSPKEIVEAKRQLAIKELYGEWCEMYRQQNNHKMHR